jgi:ABC-type dipeptide/oligopeptide/nickel transport system permease component
VLITNIALMQVAFNIPGSYREMKNALDNGDTDMLQALVVQGTIVIATANMIADLLQARLDPRVRAEWTGAWEVRPRRRRRRKAEEPGVA